MFSFLNQEPPETQEEKEALFNQLVSAAENNVISEFQLITHISEWRDIRIAIRGLEKLIVVFKNIAEEFLATYLQQLKTGTAEFPYICSYAKYKNCQLYYEKQLAKAEAELDEYWAYVGSGHFLEQFLFFNERPSELCYDHRRLAK